MGSRRLGGVELSQHYVDAKAENAVGDLPLVYALSADLSNLVDERDCRDLLHRCHVPAERHPELAAESPKEALAPRRNAIATQYCHHGPPTLASLLKWHPQRCLQCFGDGVGVIRVGNHGSVEFVGRAREGRENEHAGVIGVLCSDILLGNQVHSVAQRSDESHAAEPKEASERALSGTSLRVAVAICRKRTWLRYAG